MSSGAKYYAVGNFIVTGKYSDKVWHFSYVSQALSSGAQVSSYIVLNVLVPVASFTL